MKPEFTINDFSKHLFWDVDLSTFNIYEHKEQVVFKVLEYGKIDDWKLLKKLYGIEEIKNIALQIRSLDPVTLSFLSVIFKIEKTEFRCYKHSQSVQNVWNS
ncbi:MAG: hypothetical protein JST62_07205 [Bacteroidetes bacterium]|nr:hypothetical protein [Bacteroidota bacterium]